MTRRGYPGVGFGVSPTAGSNSRSSMEPRRKGADVFTMPEDAATGKKQGEAGNDAPGGKKGSAGRGASAFIGRAAPLLRGNGSSGQGGRGGTGMLWFVNAPGGQGAPRPLEPCEYVR